MILFHDSAATSLNKTVLVHHRAAMPLDDTVTEVLFQAAEARNLQIIEQAIDDQDTKEC
jgi:chorismate-pyruvate lyase